MNINQIIIYLALIPSIIFFAAMIYFARESLKEINKRQQKK